MRKILGFQGIGGKLSRCKEFLLLCVMLCQPASVFAELPVVMVSVPPQAYFVNRLAPGLVDTAVMIPAGANHETFEPTMTQLAELSRASLYIKVGHPQFEFEVNWIEKLLNDQPKLKVVDCSTGVPINTEDPHIWLSPRLVKIIVSNIATALSELLPGKRAELAQNLKTLISEIESLDTKIRETLLPYKGYSFIVFHPAWGYFAEEYGLKQLSMEKRGRELGMKELAELIAEAKSSGMKTIFIEPEFSTESAKGLATEIGARTRELNPVLEDWFVNMKSATLEIKQALAEQRPEHSREHK